MKKTIAIKLFTIMLLLIAACKEQDEIYPAEPRIEFIDITFDGAKTTHRDTLTLTFSIIDGDLDFGLDNSIEHLTFPFQPLFYYSKQDGTRIPSDRLDRGEIELETLIQFKDRSNPPYDTLPELRGCHYSTFSVNESDFTHLYCDINENAYNIFIKFYYQNPDGSFSEYDWYKEFCLTWNARIHSISNLPKNQISNAGPFTTVMESPRKGKITYHMVASGFSYLFESKKIKLRIYVKDRALNASNSIETPEFFLDDI